MVLALIQARMGSTRLPGKVLKPLAGIPVIEHVVHRVRSAAMVDDVMVVTSIDPSNIPLIHVVSGLGCRVFVGSEDDVLDRFWQATRLTDADHLVRVTADCPVIDPDVIDSVIRLHVAEKNHYTSNTDPPTWPDGLDVEVMTRAALETAWSKARSTPEREHVTPYIRNNPQLFKTGGLRSPVDLSVHRWTLDQDEDYALLQSVFDELYKPSGIFRHGEILDLLLRKPELTDVNATIQRNEGYAKSLREELYKDG